MTHTIRYMAGGCVSGTGRGRSKIKWHAVEGECGHGWYPPALCGRKPAIQWSDERPDTAVTCPACLRALKRRER